MDALNGLKPDWFILDHYALDARWETTLRPHCGKMMVIDDLADRDHDCDILLDQNLVANLTDRYAQWVSNRTTCLLGPHYAMLQREYAEWREQTPPRKGRIRRLLVYFGGADVSNQTGRTLSAFLELKRTEIALDVVINPQSPHAPEIKKQAAKHSNIIVHETLPSLAPLMIKADLAIGAGGSTSWERCCLGLPSLVITLAENQKPLAEALDRKGLICWLGHHDQVDLSTIKDALQTALLHESLESWSQQCRKLVDGKGVERVVEIMLLNQKTPLTARSATLDDERVMGSLMTETMKSREQDHLQVDAPRDIRDWFYKHLRHPETSRIYTLTTGQGLPIGMVRFEFHDDQWDMFYLLNHYAQNRHLLEGVLNCALRTFRHSYHGTLSFGSVKPEPGPDSSKKADSPFSNSRKNSNPLTITICSDAKS